MLIISCGVVLDRGIKEIHQSLARTGQEGDIRMMMNNNKNKMMSNLMRCVSSSDLIDAKLEEHQLCGSKQCPGCGHSFEPTKPEGGGVVQDWVGLPAGVKFDPTDQELIEHLEAKVESKNMKNKSHPLIDEFIPTIEGDDGICYTHPDKLPGVRRDGLSRHFFHRPSKAYTTGTRKRRKIQSEECEMQGGGETRWHKTGKTRAVMVSGKQKGCKKILVLYTNFGKNRKPEKTNWVMHQYHLGLHEEEREGELVVSKIFYQTHPRQCNYWSSSSRSSSENNTTSTTTAAAQELIINNNSNSNNNKEMLVSERDSRDEMCGVVPPLTSFTTTALSSDHFGFIPFTKAAAFDDQVGIGEAREQVEAAAGGSCEQQVHDHHQQIIATTAFHMSRPSHPISTLISPPPLHHNNSSSYHLSTIMLQNHHFQQQHHHHKLGGGGRSASGLEEIIMGCTSTDHHIKEASSSMTNPQEAEWLKYSSYWHDPAHHGS